MDNIPFEDQLVIDELVEFWRTHNEPPDLFDHARSTLRQGCNSLTFFFLTVRSDLRTDKRNQYTASSALEFRQFLEVECRRLYQPCAERQKAEAQGKEKEREERKRRFHDRFNEAWKAMGKEKEREERKRRAREDFDALEIVMAKATTRAELVELGRKRAELVPYTGSKYVYENVCWCCHSRISSAIHARCPDCRWYICSSCGSCSRDCGWTYNPVNVEDVDPFLGML